MEKCCKWIDKVYEIEDSKMIEILENSDEPGDGYVELTSMLKSWAERNNFK